MLPPTLPPVPAVDMYELFGVEPEGCLVSEIKQLQNHILGFIHINNFIMSHDGF